MKEKIDKKNNNLNNFFYREINLFIFIGSIIIVIIGGTFTYFITKNIENKTKGEFLSDTNIFVAGVNPTRIENLTNTPADSTNQDYQRLEEQLSKMENAAKGSGIRWIYTMFKKDNDIIFGPDSIPKGEYGHSEPGDIYTSASTTAKQAFLNAIENKGSEVFGPDTDEWGTWLSFFVPIKDFQSEKIVGVLGIDIDYQYYKTAIFQQQLLPLVSTILCLIIFISISLYLTRLKKIADELKSNEEKYLKLYNESIKDSQKIKEKIEKINKMSLESSNMNKLMVGRELKMIELKKEIEKLRKI